MRPTSGRAALLMYSATFQTPDPGGMATADPSDPGSWNRYGYAGGDPVNFYDPAGSCRVGTSNYADGGPECPDVTSITVSGLMGQVGPGGGSDGYGGAPPPWDGTGWKRGYTNEIHDGLSPEARAILGLVYNQTSFLATGKFWGQWLATSVALEGAGAYAAGVYYASAAGGIAALEVASGPGSMYVIGSGAALQGALGPNGTKLMELPQAAYTWALNQSIL